MDVFKLHQSLIGDYSSYIHSFINIRDPRMSDFIKDSLERGLLWPEPLIQLSPSFELVKNIDELVGDEVLHKSCQDIFRKDKDSNTPGKEIRLYRHQWEAIAAAKRDQNYVLTTGTGSGKSLAYFVPIVNSILREGPGKGIKAIIVYPQNALVNSQYEALAKYINYGCPPGTPEIRFARYTGQENEEQRHVIRQDPPDILITNYVMLELILTRREDRPLVDRFRGLRFLVMDELHTYRGRQGSDVALLIRRLRNRVKSERLQCVGTSATIAGGGTYKEQQKKIAETAELLFGDVFLPENIIGETLKRATKEENLQDRDFINRLKQRVMDIDYVPPTSYEAFTADPLSCWLESTLGIRMEPGSDRLIRQEPHSITGEKGIAGKLSHLTKAPVKRCEEVIRRGLLAGYECEAGPDGFKPFAFRVHQFISRSGSVYSTLETEDKRHLTVTAQKFVPGEDRSRVLFPVVFCRECGQEYYKVMRRPDGSTEAIIAPWTNEEENAEDNNARPGYIYINSDEPWPEDFDERMRRIPEEWLEEHRGSMRIKPDRKKYLPEEMLLATDGKWNENGLRCHFVPKPFKFCLKCGISYFRQRTEFAKLSSLASEGRSTATTILSLSTIKHLRRENELPAIAKKLLSFMDNRQDASLQAGHLNDFVETGLLRAAIYKALAEAGEKGLTHDELALRIFAALNLPSKDYAANPEARFTALEQIQKALRQVLGYRMYVDLRKGWRVTSPNLEQCDLLHISYPDLEAVCAAGDLWENCHPALAQAGPGNRKKVTKVLLDYIRRELAIKVDYLKQENQERMMQNSSQHLVAPWGIDENENLERARVVFPCSRPRERGRFNPHKYHVFLSARSGFGYYLLRSNTFENYTGRLRLEDASEIIQQLLEALRKGGILELAYHLNNSDDNPVPGYQLLAAAMQWKAGDGRRVELDPVRFPSRPDEGGKANTFFVDFYRAGAREIQGLEAREHTAQVKPEHRQEREERFKNAALPILYCSPTMELGVDIRDLNVVNMRNVPPTPANYAQRGGRAGRSGQPALIFTYCSVGSSHDQYFFKHPPLMVAGAVKTPCLDLANEDLIRAHIHAVWLAETGLSLGTTLKEILDISGDNPTLEIKNEVRDSIFKENVKRNAFQKASRIMEEIKPHLGNAEWYTTDWLEHVIERAASSFDLACNRWRTLYRSAWEQYIFHSRMTVDASRKRKDKKNSEDLMKDAKKQLDLLVEEQMAVNSDFYSYRYFATEGFLPGYNFPRLPIYAYMRGRKVRSKDGFLARPRFVAISEFGPRATVYHEGSRYVIHKVMLPVSIEGDLQTTSARCCPNCGYLHPHNNQTEYNVCEICETELDLPMTQLFRLQNVSTIRRDRITSDEEERLRLGFHIKTVFRFNERDGIPLYRMAEVKLGDVLLARMKYAAAATIWRMNQGLRRQVRRGHIGYELDMESGCWERHEDEESPEDFDSPTSEEPMSGRRMRVTPYVEDHRNCLLFSPGDGNQSMPIEFIASLQAALKRAIQVEFQLEDNELAVEPLPDVNDRRQLLFYEAAEGGAGVLRMLTHDPNALARVAKTALALCHFEPDSHDDTDIVIPGQQSEQCSAACYDCLMSYFNQTDHEILDRTLIKDFLTDLTGAGVELSPATETRQQHFQRLVNMADSELEKQWLNFLEKKKLNLPTGAQKLIKSCQTRPDFLFQAAHQQVAVYIDGPVHLYPDRQKRDREQEECLEDQGIRVIRFSHQDDWQKIIEQHPDVFGNP
ncbi:MAG: DEAD/DEAH box helicase [Candidatus Aminicenantes bacterium]|nr:DEAD/DEAH box helicase [Candidatus Aminicenantes bacterium]NIM79993.1 DEAD/DEAH box helicase [Candidatus Aminicenantes bacterium]NIN19346.1 DEAD/DEAH box helicase [Candidatus Aminicenantes bacterium]NIN43245.1 DEAD/DEAH box helicase [Candidatus Aminicenantes bacterium]NIN85987.1 DEAD/DEAH box helicase [Candidatus Aminicenantes bacterium]